MTSNLASPEIKALAPQDDFEAMMRAFAAFRDTNDERLQQIERRMSADVVTEDKLSRIEKGLDDARHRLDTMAIERARPRLAGSEEAAAPAQEREHKAAFRTYMQTGEGVSLKALEAKAMSSLSGPDGGYLVPPPVERDILRRLAQISPIRALASSCEISTSNFRKAFSTTGPASGWVAETDARPQTANQQIADMSFPAMELYAMPAATQNLLDDTVVDVEQWIASEIDTVFAEQEGTAFVNGNGVNKPMGFMSYTKVAQSAAGWGKTAYVATGASGALPASNPSDILFDLVYALRAGYRQNATFLMNRKTLAVIRKLKATTGEYLWAPPATPDGKAMLLNFPLVESEDMPDIAADAFPIAFGNFKRAYLIVDRRGIRVLRDPYSAKPYVLFYTTKRVGGGLQDFDALRLLKTGTA